jgi:acyl-CoA synthetase (NDP forming)
MSLLAPPDIMQRYRDAGYLTFEDPCRAISAAAALAGFGLSFAQAQAGEPATEASLPDPVNLPARPLSEWESREILSAAGLPVVAGRLVKNADEAAQAAADFGFPVAMKVNGADIAHKTEIGGVALNVATAEDARALHDDLLSRASDYSPDGIIVSPMVQGGVEAILGVQVDPVFGPAVMFGLGGVFVEIFEDVSFRLAPFGRDEALAMIAETKGAALLKGVRGRPPADMGALADALVALSRFAAAQGSALASIDLNPFLVLGDGKGCLALDCLVVPARDDA